MHRALPIALPLLLPLLTVACADPGSAPSLSPRPIETMDLNEPVAASNAPPPPADPALAARYAAIVATAQAGDAAFAREESGTRAVASRATRAAIGSDAWTAAQLAVTRLEAARGPVAKALGDLDAERTSGDTDLPALEAAVAQVTAIDERERRQLAAIARMLPTP